MDNREKIIRNVAMALSTENTRCNVLYICEQ